LVLTNNESLFTNSSVDYTKYCGNYDTANAFGLWMASILLKENQLSELEVEKANKPERILLHNAAKDGKHSLIILENVEL
ncbi:MAG: hypothetical protein MI922_15415, partial [Bacteroidales bacterium]|nr:hypothetical protein [Bacteroidales bacterium]